MNALVPSLSRRRLAFALPLLAGLPQLAAAQPAAAGPLLRQSRELMGTRVDLAVALPPGAAAPQQAQAQAAMARAFAEMQRLEALMSRYRPDSDVARVAAAAGRHPVRVAPQVLGVLRTAQQLHQDSAGAFDATVGALDGWHFEAGRQSVPPAHEVAQALRLVDGRALQLDERAGTAYLARPGMRLDLGGVAKLPILQAGLRTLAGAGLGDALVNGGGDVLVSGTHHGQPWRVGLRDPAMPQRLLGVLAVQGPAVVASSGDYERGFVHGGRRLHHVLDPRTGWPTQGVHGVALVASTVEQVNGWGAALMVQGPGHAAAWSARHPGVDVLVASATGERWTSAGMRTRLAA